jgi:hypothetical protein
MGIVGYTYNAEQYHPHCLIRTFTDGEYDTAEGVLDRAAIKLGIDRTNEHSYDSGDFPKVIFYSDIEPNEQCDICGKSLI